MARPWRLRHKLVLGLALVVGSVVLLLAGSLHGLWSYLVATKTIEAKTVELQSLHNMVELLKDQPNKPSEYRTLIQHIREALNYYEHEAHANTVRRGLDPDGGYQERGLIEDLQAALDKLELALEGTTLSGPVPTLPLRDNPGVKDAEAKLRQVVHQLRSTVFDDISLSIDRARAEYRRSVVLAIGSAVAAVLLVLTLLYYFRQWVFVPIRQIQAGVHRVHGGDFDHPIGVANRDELGELADEFNAMTTRLRDIYKDLARQVNERSRQLVRSERMVSVGFLAAGVAHEINNPLASIAFCSEALERRLQDALGAAPAEAEVVTKYLKMIQQEAFRCKEITTKLLDFSRAGERRKEPTDLGGLIRGVLEIAQHLQNCRGKQVVFKPDTYVVAPVNAPDLKSVVLNLVVNALDSMDEGGVLTIAMTAGGEAAELTFTDTGCGMPADVLENIFEPFFTRSRTGKGTGLGLFISHQIIDQHGGTIHAASTGPGKGSTFTVRLPLRERAEQPGSEPAVLPFPGAKPAAAA